VSTSTFEPSLSSVRQEARPIHDSFERISAALLLALTSPVIIGSAAVVMVLSRKSPFVAHRRVGQGGRTFWMWKLRSMWPGPGGRGLVERIVAEPPDDFKDPADPRVTSRFAAFCRRYSIDELPQLWHVVHGQMSLVGPRPLTRSELARHYGSLAAELLSVKPGITGIWQVNGRSTIRFPERVALDLELVRALTPRRYWMLLLKTIPAVLRGRGAW
jgi:exopolysaccharide production protein ExoY